MTETDYPYKAYVTKAKSHPSLENISETLTPLIHFFFFSSTQEDECEYKPELAAAFVKNVVNITLVSEHECFLQTEVGEGSVFNACE